MGDGISDLTSAVCQFGIGPRMDGCCDHCGELLPKSGVVWAGTDRCKWKWHRDCAPGYILKSTQH